jgi:hypothetical protein
MRAAVPITWGRELSGRAAGSAEKAEAEAVKDPTAATRWSERHHTARLEVRTLSAAPNLNKPHLP